MIVFSSTAGMDLSKSMIFAAYRDVRSSIGGGTSEVMKIIYKWHEMVYSLRRQ